GTPIRWYHVVVWSSQTNAQGLRLNYRTAQRVYWPEATLGNRIPAPMQVPGTQTPPYLPPERYLSYTMASVSGQQLVYPNPVSMKNFHRFYSPNTTPPTQAEVLERKPGVRPGGDSIVFLRGRLKVDEASNGEVVAVPTVREERMGPSVTDRYRFAQGIIDPNVPIINEIYDEMAGSQPASNNPVHRLNGVSSVQLTVRSDVKFAPEAYNNRPMIRYPYILIADTDGVWEGRLLPGNQVPQPPQGMANLPRPQFRLTMAFTLEDYAYVTGAGNGDPARIYTPGNHSPGGRLLSAVSARRLPSGLILVASRTPLNEQPFATELGTHLNSGPDVFLLRASDYRTATERAALGAANGGPPPYAPYIRQLVQRHGWQPDQWVQTKYGAGIPQALRGAPSIRWRAAEQIDPAAEPTLRTQTQGGLNPYELSGTYIPVQPNFADLVY
ncbi:MAG TPA: hypothetical protein VK689_10260, partial [Armatimonadota bacterium]|nr:hypothetical protein [Armatimonadota bacterium]